VLDQYRGKPGALIPVLQKVQYEYGWLAQPIVEHIARELNIYLSEVHGVVSFYAQFYTKPRGRYTIQICRGTACHVKGSLRILEQLAADLGVDAGEMTKDGKFIIEEVNCIGACGIAPVLVVTGKTENKTFGSLTVAQALESIRNFSAGT
jgi:NADH-quinone oxidoreductase subunit E